MDAMKRITLGIHLKEPGELGPTLESVRACSPQAEVVLLPDAPGAAAGAPAELPRLYGASGGAAAFNRLASGTDSELIVFLEGGCRVAPDWLERLLYALAADPAHGLAGPSTNRAWNDQCAFPGAGGAPAALARTARDAASQHGDAFRTLLPLHSLADFCYAVRREVIDAVGAADEGYGAGPCWEMEYNARAARAGFLGVWACGAYVYRPPLSRRRAVDARRLEAGKRRYQDRLCALRLRRERDGYERHCRGETCEHFAPRALIQIHRPFGEPPSAKAAAAPPAIAVDDRPLVSCLMPTADRRRFVPRAIEYFRRQDYPRCELLIVDDGADPIADLVPDDPRIRYLRLERRLSLGAKRNLACREARGEILLHWDDDDWHAPHRVSYQVAELRRRNVELCGLDRLLFFDPAADRAWRYHYPQSGRRWLAGGTFCFTRELWRRHPFPEVTVGEDNRFVWSAATEKVAALTDETIYLALVHPRNTSRKRCVGACWHPAPAARVRALLGADADFYDALARGPERDAEPPLVSCIMPTRNRRPFIPLALRCFERQDYPRRELVIVDDGDDPIADLLPADPAIRYLRLAGRHTVGAKRNRACEAARGEIVVHWDDDDWYAPGRLTAQTEEILAGRAEVTALAMRYVLTLDPFRFWSCPPKLHARLHYRDLCPGTIAYRRELWRRRGYPHRNCAEDVAFLRTLPGAARLRRLAREDLFLCLRHGANTWSIPVDPQHEVRGWEAIPAPDFLPAADLALYDALAPSGPRTGDRFLSHARTMEIAAC